MFLETEFFKRSDASLFGRTATVVRDGRHIRNIRDLHAARIERTHRRFAARARALYAHFQRLYAVFLRGYTGLFRRDLRSERRALARTAKAAAAGRRRRQHVALAIRDRDDRVVERSMHVRDR